MSTYNSKEFEELKELIRENHKILKGLQTKARFATLFTVIKWSIVIAIAIGLFAYLQPILQNIISAYNVLMENISLLNDTKNSVTGVVDISELIKIFGQAKQ